VNGTNADNILVGDDNASTFDGGAGDDIVFAGGGDDTIIQVSTEGHDILDGGAGNDTYQLNGNNTAETFNIYTRTAWLGLGNVASSLAPNTEIIVTRNGVVIAELDNIEEIGINTLAVTANDGDGALNGGANTGDTINIFGNFNAPETSLSFSTITVDGGAGRDTVNITGLVSDHRIVFNTNDATDSIVGAVRPQDVVGGAAAAPSKAGGAYVMEVQTGSADSGKSFGISKTGISGSPEVNINKFDIEAPSKLVTPVSDIDLMAEHIIQTWMLTPAPNGTSLWLADVSPSEPPRTFFALEDAFDDLRVGEVSTRPDADDFGPTTWTDSDFSKTFDKSHLVDGDYA
jgi:hypothetical protein